VGQNPEYFVLLVILLLLEGLAGIPVRKEVWDVEEYD
jgi:hypothetical protein